MQDFGITGKSLNVTILQKSQIVIGGTNQRAFYVLIKIHSKVGCTYEMDAKTLTEIKFMLAANNSIFVNCFLFKMISMIYISEIFSEVNDLKMYLYD